MFTQRRDPRPRTTEEAVAWLELWNNGHWISMGAFPVRPWRRTSPSELESVADALLKLRAAWGGRLGSGDTSAESGGAR